MSDITCPEREGVPHGQLIQESSRWEIIRALCIVCLPVVALLWLILWAGGDMSNDVAKWGWIVWAVAVGVVL